MPSQNPNASLIVSTRNSTSISMPEPAYTPEDIEAAHTLLQIYYNSSSSNNSNAMQTPSQSGDVSSPAQHQGRRPSCSCGSGRIIPANQIIHNSTLSPSHAQPILVGQAAGPVPMSNLNQPRVQQSTNQVTEQMQPPPGRSQSVPPLHAKQSNHNAQSPEQKPPSTIQNQALQEHLFRQQRIAGIAPQNMITIPDQRNDRSQSGGQGCTPALVKITREGAVLAPHIPPVRFNGVLHAAQTPFPVQVSTAPFPTGPALASDPANHTIRRTSQTIAETRNAAQLNSPQRRFPMHVEDVGNNRAMAPARQNASQSTTAITTLLGYSAPRSEVNSSSSRSRSPLPSRSNGQQEQRNGFINQQTTTTPSAKPSQAKTSESTSTDRDSVTTEDEPAFEGVQNRRPFHYLDIPGALTGFPQLALMVIDLLGVDDFINTATASKRFYLFVRGNPHTTITRVAFNHFPENARLYPYPCYRKYTLDVRRAGPSSNQEQRNNTSDAINKQPFLRWLKMLRFRENLIKELMDLFDKGGYTLTSRCSTVLKKIWFLMDIPDNRRRLSTVQNKLLWSDTELFHAVFILAQIESRFTGHKVGTPRQSLRRVVMAQKTPILLRNALKGTALRTPFEVLKEFMRWRYRPLPYEADMNLFGVPPGEVGRLQYEYYGAMGSRVRMYRPDELLLKECSRRQLDILHMYATAYLQGETDPSLPRNYTLEPEASYLHEVISEARRKNTSDWLKDAVLDKY